MSTYQDLGLVAGPGKLYRGLKATGATCKINSSSGINTVVTDIPYDTEVGTIAATGRLHVLQNTTEYMLVTAKAGGFLKVVRGDLFTDPVIASSGAVLTEYEFKEYKTIGDLSFDLSALNKKTNLKSSQYGVEVVYGASEDEPPFVQAQLVEHGYENLQEMFEASNFEVIDASTPDKRYFEIQSKAGIDLSSDTLAEPMIIKLKSKTTDEYTSVFIPKSIISETPNFSFNEDQVSYTVKFDALIKQNPITENEVYAVIGDRIARA